VCDMTYIKHVVSFAVDADMQWKTRLQHVRSQLSLRERQLRLLERSTINFSLCSDFYHKLDFQRIIVSSSQHKYSLLLLIEAFHSAFHTTGCNCKHKANTACYFGI